MIRCPVCGRYEFEFKDNFEICEICGWENDDLQMEYPDMEGGANDMSLNQAREAWKRGEKVI